MSKVTVSTLQAHKAAGEKFAVITAYDASFSRVVDEAGIEVILVGDSLGMVLHGTDSTLPVTVDDMAYHTSAVISGCKDCLVIADMPFGSYFTLPQTLETAAELMSAGAHMVKMEGGQWLLESITALNERGIPVCGHLGLTPQSVNTLGGYKVQGRDEDSAEVIVRDALALEAAGASLLVLECVPTNLAGLISSKLSIPVIGIGAGPETDAQVLVLHDMLGLSVKAPRFVRNFMDGQHSIQGALSAYNEAVKNGSFPTPEHSFSQ